MIDLTLLWERALLAVQRPYRRWLIDRLIARCTDGERVIFFFPDYRRHNPHQALLARAMPPRYHYLAGCIEDACYVQRKAQGRLAVHFHLHWPDPILRPQAFARFMQRMAQFQQGGGRVIWSIHNLFPREVSEQEVAVMQRQLAAQVDRIHLFTRASLSPLTAQYGVSEDRCLIAMRGHYIDSYANTVSKGKSRQRLGLPQDNRVLCFFGQLRPYKGLDALLDVFDALPQERISLVLAGRYPPRARPMMRATIARAKRMPNVRLFLDFVTGHAVQYYLNAADILVLPYTDMINSGSYVLGLSFGCCMVVPLEGAVAELATHGVDAITYDPRDPDGLKQAVEQALAMSEAERAAIGAQAFVLAQRLHWRHTAQAICGALDEG